MAVTPGADGEASGVENPSRGGAIPQGSTWFPLVLFGAIALAASPLYRGWPSGTADLFGLSGYFSGPPDPHGANPGKIAVFWLVAAPLGYLAILAFYRARGHRGGSVFPTRVYLMTGLGLAALLAANFLAQRAPLLFLSDLYIRALTPLFTVTVGLFVLAYSQRSRSLAIFTVVFFGLVVLVNLYDLAGLTGRFGIDTDDRTNIVVVGVTLLLAGTAFGFGERAASHKERSYTDLRRGTYRA
jgi:hypothetical protein